MGKNHQFKTCIGCRKDTKEDKTLFRVFDQTQNPHPIYPVTFCKKCIVSYKKKVTITGITVRQYKLMGHRWILAND